MLKSRPRGGDIPKQWEGGKCVKCKRSRTKEGHDPCAADLPGVISFCCGHGDVGGHITFRDGRSFYFNGWRGNNNHR